MKQEFDDNRTLSEQQFEYNIRELSLFLNQHNRMPQKAENPLLRRWVLTLIEDRKSNALTPDLIKRLNAIGFFWNLEDSKWHKKARKIRLILLTEKRVVSRQEDGNSLYEWFTELYTRASKVKVSYGRYVFIESCKTAAIALGKTLPYEEDMKNLKAGKTWSKWFKKLVCFREQYPAEWPFRKKGNSEQNKLAAWCSHMRMLYHRDQLEPTWLSQLVQIDFPFKKKKVLLSWEDRFSEYKTFQAKHPGTPPKPGLALYNWARNQYLKFSQLTAEQQALLNNLPLTYPFNIADNEWNEKLAQTKEFLLQNGMLPYPKINKVLYGWLQWQRKLFLNNQLQESRYKHLLQAGIDIQKKPETNLKWERNYEAVNEFVKDYGRWPKYVSKGYEKKLNLWMQAQRQAVKGTLRNRNVYPQQKIDKLNDIGFRWSAKSEQEDKWHNNFEELKEFMTAKPGAKPGHLLNEGRTKLFNWITYQKTLAKNKTLSPEKCKQFASLGIIKLP